MSSHHVLRPLQESDQAELFSLHNSISSGDSPRQFARAMERAEGVWVLFLERLMVGYTAVFSVPGIDGLLEMQGVIHPDYQRRGLGTVLLQGVMDALADSPFHTISYPVENMDTAVAHFLQHHNFGVEHEEWSMIRRDLTNLPPLPKSDCTVQTFSRHKSITQFLDVYDNSFADTPWNQPFSPAEMAYTLQDEDELLFLTQKERLIGAAWLRFPERGHAEIEPIGIIRTEQGKGYGRILLTTILHKLAQQNIQTVSLGVWANNHKALALYQSVGFRHVTTVTYLAHSL